MEGNQSSNRHSKTMLMMKMGVALFPIVFLVAMEIVFRIAGWGIHASEDSQNKWDNPHISFDEDLRFFPEWTEELSTPKPEGLKRLFVIGGSSAAGYGVETDFSERLETQLKEKHTGVQWQVVNGGVGAAGSHRVFEVLKRAAQFEPDLVIVYFGHNEFLENIFFDPNGLLAKVEATGSVIRKIQVVNWLRDVLGADVKAPTLKGKKPKLKSRFLGSMNFPLIKDDAQYANKLQFLESNVRQMVGFSREKGFPLVLIPAEPNLMHFPGSPANPKNFEMIKKEWFALESDIESAVSGQDWKKAREVIERVNELDSTHARMLYYSGLAWYGLGEAQKAQADLRLAVLYDKHGDRSNADISNQILSVADAMKVPALDLTDLFNVENKKEFERMQATGLFDMTIGPVGLELFTDHCHPSEMGHEKIADALYPFLVDEGLLPIQ